MGCFSSTPQNRASAYSTSQPPQQYVSTLKNDHTKSAPSPNIWIDESFPPSDVSIFGDLPIEEIDKELLRFRGSKWVPIFPRYKLFVDKIEYKDVLQTFLGDCFFVAVVSSLAEKEGRISALFSNKGSPQGVYEVVCYYMGEKKVIKLDSYFPFVRNDKGKWETLTGTNKKESWVLFLEKAFAKEFGSYVAILAGDPMEAMRFLTGAPAAKHFTSNVSGDSDYKDSIWNLLVAQSSSENLFTCCTGEESDKLKEMKLTPDHVYTIIHAFKTRSGQRLLFIRNPWGCLDKDGNGEWIGKWSDQYLKKHIKELKDMPYEYKGEDDGLFHISFDDFLDYFESLEVCYIERDFVLQSSRQITAKTNKKKSFSLTVEENRTTSFFIMVNQESERKFLNQNFEYSAITFKVLDAKNKQIKGEMATGKFQQVGKKVTLAPGKYAVEVSVQWSDFAMQKGINHFVLNIYGPENLKLGRGIMCFN